MAEERIEGPTPNGGAYSIAYWRDDNGNPVDREQATKVEIVEYDEAGEQVWRSYANMPPSLEAREEPA